MRISMITQQRLLMPAVAVLVLALAATVIVGWRLEWNEYSPLV